MYLICKWIDLNLKRFGFVPSSLYDFKILCDISIKFQLINGQHIYKVNQKGLAQRL